MNLRRIPWVILSLFIPLLLAGAWLIALNPGAALGAPEIRYVAPGGNCGGAAPCYSDIQQAVKFSLSGDEIRIAAGTYPIPRNAAEAVLLDKSLTLRGGYTPANWTTPDPEANVTVIDAQGKGRVMVVLPGVAAVIEGLRLVNGNTAGLGFGLESGAGVYAEGASVTLRRCQVTANTAPEIELGGGIYIDQGALTLNQTIIQGNIAGSGGGLRILNSQAVIQDSQILENRANWDSLGFGGGGLLVGGASQVIITGSIIRGNVTGSAVPGGGISLLDITDGYTGTMSLSLYDTLIEGNAAGGNGGGVHILDGAANSLAVSAVIYSNTIRLNDSALNGGGIFASANITVTHNLIAGNRAGYQGGAMTNGNGGGMYVAGKALLANNRILDNLAQGSAGEGSGGGAYLKPGGGILFNNNWVIGNLAYSASGGRGGGVFASGESLRLEANTILRNAANGSQNASGGGGVHLSRSSAQVENNIIADNAVAGSVLNGSGLTIAGGSPTLNHNTFANNTGGAGQGIYLVGETTPALPLIYNAIIVSQTVGVQVSAAQQNLATLNGVLWWGNGSNGAGNLSVAQERNGDPRFVDPAGGDYHLRIGSAAIDQAVSPSLSTDIDGDLRLPLQADLGADEYWLPGGFKRLFLPLLRR